MKDDMQRLRITYLGSFTEGRLQSYANKIKAFLWANFIDIEHFDVESLHSQATYLGLHIFVSTSAPLLHLFYTKEFVLATNQSYFARKKVKNEKKEQLRKTSPNGGVQREKCLPNHNQEILEDS